MCIQTRMAQTRKMYTAASRRVFPVSMVLWEDPRLLSIEPVMPRVTAAVKARRNKKWLRRRREMRPLGGLVARSALGGVRARSGAKGGRTVRRRASRPSRAD